jgi:hypothetical protein
MADVHPSDALDDVAADLRTVFVRDPEPEVAVRHLAAMQAAAGSHRSHTGRRVAVGLGAAAGTLVLTAGLAAAGVLPSGLRHDVDRLVRPLGISVSHDDSHDPASGGHAPASTTTAPGRSGTAPGHTKTGGDNKPTSPPGQTTSHSATPTTTSTSTPGKSGSAPGHSTTTTSTTTAPGRSGTAPGHTKAGGDNKPTSPPGQTKPKHSK